MSMAYWDRKWAGMKGSDGPGWGEERARLDMLQAQAAEASSRADIARQQAQSGMTGAQVDAIRAGTGLTRANTDYRGKEIQWFDPTRQAEINKIIAERFGILADANKSLAEADATKTQTDWTYRGSYGSMPGPYRAPIAMGAPTTVAAPPPRGAVGSNGGSTDWDSLIRDNPFAKRKTFKLSDPQDPPGPPQVWTGWDAYNRRGMP